MPERLPQSVAKRVPLKAYLSSDHVSAATGKTIAVVISKNGAAFGNPSGGATNATEIASGWYYVDLSTTDTGTLGPLIVRGTVSGVDDSEISYTIADAHNAGFDGLPSAVAGASGGVPLSVDSAGRIDVLKINGTSQTGRDIGASVLLSAGTGTGQLDFTSGVVKANLAQILGTALTETSGLLAGAFKKFFNVASPTLTCLDINQTGDSYARIGAPAGASASADIAAVKTDTAAIKAKTDNLPSSPAATGDAMALTSGERTTVASVISDEVWDEAITDHLTSGTTGAALNAAGSAGDPWTTPLPGAYGAGTAGKIVGDNLDAAVSTRLATSGYTAPDNSDIAAIKAKTDNLPASPAAVGDIPTATQNADALLKRDMSAVSGEAARSPLNAIRFLRNKWGISGTTLTVTKEDDTTTAWTGTVSTDASAVPIIGSDPA